MSDKRILFVANVAKEHINKFHIPTIKCFKKHGWIVDVACSGEENVPECDHQYHMCWKRSPFTLRTIKGIWDLKKIITREKYDIVYCHTPVGGLVARLAAIKARKKGTKVIYCAHGLHFFKGAPKKNWLIYYPIEKLLSYLTDTIFTVNREDYYYLTKHFSTKIELVPEVGVNFDRLIISDKEQIRMKYREDMKIDDNTTALIYVAEIIANKNQKMLIDTTKLLLDRGENVCLILPGPEHDNGNAYKYACEIGIEDDIRFLGWRNDIGELMIAADICVASSIREGFGINLVEAMYCGLPVIATNNRGHEMIIEHGENGFLVGINATEDMAKYVTKLIHDEELKNKISNIDVSKYDCNLIAEELYELLLKTIQ